MEVFLPPDLEDLIRDKVGGGRYHSASDVVCEGLRLLKERDDLQNHRREELRHDIAVGLKQLDEGRSTVLDEQTLEGIKARGRERLARQQQGKGP